MTKEKDLFEVLTAEQILEILSRDEERLSGELRELRKFHSAAWAEYGSELCSGEMQRNEGAVANKISKIRKMKEIVLSRKLNGQMVKIILADLGGLIVRAEELREFLNKDKEALAAEKDLFTDLLDIVNK